MERNDRMPKDEKIKSTIHAMDIDISVLTSMDNSDYISLTDIARYRNPEAPGYVIQNWMRNRSTVDFLGLWEKTEQPGF